MTGSLIYALVRVLLDLYATSRRDYEELQAEVLALRRQRSQVSPLAAQAVKEGPGRPEVREGWTRRSRSGCGPP